MSRIVSPQKLDTFQTSEKFSILHPKSKTPPREQSQARFLRPTISSQARLGSGRNVGAAENAISQQQPEDIKKPSKPRQKTRTQTIKQDGNTDKHVGGDARELDDTAAAWDIEPDAQDDRAGGKKRGGEDKAWGMGRLGGGNKDNLSRFVKDRSANLNGMLLRSSNLCAALTPHVCSRLEYLYLRGNKLRGLWDTQSTPMLRVVDLGENEIESLNGLSHLTSLQHLYANSNALRSMDEVPSLKQLRVLSLSCNLLSSFEGMWTLPELEVLCLSDNRIDSIVGLASCPKLDSIRLSGTIFAERPQYRLATQLSAAACGIRALRSIDGAPFSESEIELAASLAWPQRLSALYGWMPHNTSKSYEESYAFLLALQVGSAQWEREQTVVWLDTIHGSGVAVETRDVTFEFVWRHCSAEDMRTRAESAQRELQKVSGEIERCVCMALRQAQGYLWHEAAMSSAIAALQQANWRFSALSPATQAKAGGLGGTLAALLERRRTLVPLAASSGQVPVVAQFFQWYAVDDWGNTRKIDGADQKVYRVQASDVGLTLKAECTCRVSTSGVPNASSRSGDSCDEEGTPRPRVYDLKAFAYTRKVQAPKAGKAEGNMALQKEISPPVSNVPSSAQISPRTEVSPRAEGTLQPKGCGSLPPRIDGSPPMNSGKRDLPTSSEDTEGLGSSTPREGARRRSSTSEKPSSISEGEEDGQNDECELPTPRKDSAGCDSADACFGLELTSRAIEAEEGEKEALGGLDTEERDDRVGKMLQESGKKYNVSGSRRGKDEVSKHHVDVKADEKVLSFLESGQMASCDTQEEKAEGGSEASSHRSRGTEIDEDELVGKVFGHLDETEFFMDGALSESSYNSKGTQMAWTRVDSSGTLADRVDSSGVLAQVDSSGIWGAGYQDTEARPARDRSKSTEVSMQCLSSNSDDDELTISSVSRSSEAGDEHEEDLLDAPVVIKGAHRTPTRAASSTKIASNASAARTTPQRIVPVIDYCSFSHSPPLQGVPLRLDVECLPSGECECTYAWYRVRQYDREHMTADSRRTSNLAVHLPVQGNTYIPTHEDIGKCLLVVVMPWIGLGNKQGDPIEAFTDPVQRDPILPKTDASTGYSPHRVSYSSGKDWDGHTTPEAHKYGHRIHWTQSDRASARSPPNLSVYNETVVTPSGTLKSSVQMFVPQMMSLSPQATPRVAKQRDLEVPRLDEQKLYWGEASIGDASSSPEKEISTSMHTTGGSEDRSKMDITKNLFNQRGANAISQGGGGLRARGTPPALEGYRETFHPCPFEDAGARPSKTRAENGASLFFGDTGVGSDKNYNGSKESHGGVHSSLFPGPSNRQQVQVPPNNNPKGTTHQSTSINYMSAALGHAKVVSLSPTYQPIAESANSRSDYFVSPSSTTIKFMNTGAGTNPGVSLSPTRASPYPSPQEDPAWPSLRTPGSPHAFTPVLQARMPARLEANTTTISARRERGLSSVWADTSTAAADDSDKWRLDVLRKSGSKPMRSSPFASTSPALLIGQGSPVSSPFASGGVVPLKAASPAAMAPLSHARLSESPGTWA